MTYIPRVGLTWNEIKSKLETETDYKIKPYDTDLDGIIDLTRLAKVDEKVLSAAAYQVDFLNLDLNSVKQYILTFSVEMAGSYSGNAYVGLCFNNDFTATNYYTQYLTAAGTTTNPNLNNDSTIFIGAVGETILGIVIVGSNPSGYPIYYGLVHEIGGSSPKIRVLAGNYTQAGNVTSIHIYQWGETACLGAGSWFRLYKLI